MKNSLAKAFKKVMVFWTLFIGIGAVFGATCMLIRPDGSLLKMQGIIPFFQVLPFSKYLFQNFIFPGISLLIVNGLSNLIACYYILKNRYCGAVLGCVFGFTLMLWITIQFVIFPPNFMSTLYFIFGLAQFICGYLYIIFFKQSNFTFNKDSYTNIGKEPKTLVVYFSRLGYTKKLAYEKANVLGADIYEITTPERTDGFLGFAWLGRFGMHKWALPINPVDIDVSSYEKVIIVSPVHVFTVASPVKGFCESCKGMLKNVEYIIVHFRNDSDFASSFDVMDKSLETVATKKTSITCKFGKVVKVRNID